MITLEVLANKLRIFVGEKGFLDNQYGELGVSIKYMENKL